MLAQSGRREPDDVRLADIVASETDRLNQLVTDFLAFAKPSPQRLASVDLGLVVSQTLDVMTHGPTFAGVELERSIEPNLTVWGDAAQLRQACWNLVTNAAQAMAGRSGRVRVLAYRREREVHVDVQDEGPGIPPEAFRRLFEPFFTTKVRGTGLGLSTVRAIVQAHRGHIEPTNLTPHGAQFSISVPALESTEPVVQQASQQPVMA